MKAIYILLSVLLTYSAWSTTGQENLIKMLDIDRFHTYSKSWAHTMKARGHAEAADLILKLTPEELAKMQLDPKKMGDAFNYDEMLIAIIKKQNPRLATKPAELKWNYNFYKRKLNEAYDLQGVKIQNLVPDELETVKINPPEVADSQILLDVDEYVADRTTRAVFWEASREKRLIEFHVGTPGSFREHILAREGKIIAEVKTKARNYNPIYLVQYPDQKDFSYAITEIAGSDRLEHLSTQAALIRWENSNGRLAPPPPLAVVGDALNKLETEKVHLTQVLRNTPKVDKVIIGQKGAFEKTFMSIGKAQAILELANKKPMVLKSALDDPDFIKFLGQLQKTEDLIDFSMKESSKIDNLYNSVIPLLEKYKLPLAVNPTVFSLDRGSYEMSDYILKDKNGKDLRWRIFSNVWGDEVLPIAEALKATGTKDIVYIGTAGALPDTGLKVGDLVVPKNAISPAGKNYTVSPVSSLPEGAKRVDTVVNVTTPFIETEDWLKGLKGKAQVVEVETAHLASVFSGKEFSVRPYLLISDVVGVEGETLASASSSARRKSQISILKEVMTESNVVAPSSVKVGNNLVDWVNELAPKRDPVSRFHLFRLADGKGISTKAQLSELIKTTPGFTTARVDNVLNAADAKIWLLEELFEQKGLNPKIYLDRKFLEGRWSPTEVPKVQFVASSKEELAEILKVIDEARAIDPKLAKTIDVTALQASPTNEWMRVAEIPENGLFQMHYQDTALRFGGLATTETTSGNLKFVEVAEPTSGSLKSTLAYFPPDEETSKLLRSLQGEGNSAQVLKNEIAELNKAAGPNKPWEIITTTVDELPNGVMAQIVPEISGKADNLTIHLRITKEGLKNPAVVLEELIHLQQITGAPVPWKKNTQLKSFVHPFHWAEVVANARAGSLQAAEKLARLELEAARTSEDAIRYYRKNGLFSADGKLIDDYLVARAGHAEKLHKDVAKAARLDRKQREEAWERAKKVFDKLESQSDKLNDLIAKNDRKGVRKLIEAYLPWSLMEPSEKKVWSEWLEAMEKPNRKNVDLVFRGMYDDTVLRAKDGKPYLMSTVLTRNQGSYTRRLRSLSTMREKFGSQALRDNFSHYNLSGSKNPGSVSVLMANHAIEAKGSPFISTAAYDVATKFGPRQIGAFHLEPRRFALNALAPDKYLYQKERLTPLIIFPDEVVFFHDYAANPVEGVGPRDPANRKKHFIGEVEKVLGRKVTQAEIQGVGTDKDFMKESFEKLKPLILEKDKLPSVGAGCLVQGSGGCNCLFQALDSLLK
jgi:hypothetical protein